MKGFAVFLSALLVPAISMAAGGTIPPTQIHLSASADYQIADSALRATLSAQAEGTDPASLAAHVNQTISWAVSRILPGVPGLQWYTAGYATIRTGLKTAPWRVQESIVIRSNDPSALLPLLGTLQSRLQLEGIDFVPAPEDLRKAGNRASVMALQRFRADAAKDCNALGFSKTPRLGEIEIQTGPVPYAVKPFPAMMAATAMPGPVTANPGSFHGRAIAEGTAYCK